MVENPKYKINRMNTFRKSGHACTTKAMHRTGQSSLPQLGVSYTILAEKGTTSRKRFIQEAQSDNLPYLRGPESMRDFVKVSRVINRNK